jgi:O-antigen/teichoic acid export membrane protein
VLALLAAGRQRLMMAISIGGAVLNVLLNLWTIPRFGIEGAAWATVVTEAFVLASAMACASRCTGLRLPALALLRAVACAGAGMAALAALLAQLGPERTGLRVAAGLGVGALAALATGVLPPHFGTDDGSGADGNGRNGDLA